MNDIEDRTNRLTKKVAASLQQGLLTVTPVDTSQALSNWIIQLETPVDEPIFAHIGGKAGSTASGSRAIAIRLAQTALYDREIGQPIYISNVLSYIGFLNDGSSTQAPAGFVQVEVKKAAKIAQRGIKSR